MSSFLQDSPTRTIHATYLLTSFYVTLPTAQYLAYSTNRDASHYAVFSSLPPLRPKYLPEHLFSNTLGLCFFLNVTDQDSHPYKKQVTTISALNMVPVVTKITTSRSCIRVSLVWL